VQGKAKHYFLPVYNARTINPEYHSHLLYYKINPTNHNNSYKAIENSKMTSAKG